MDEKPSIAKKVAAFFIKFKVRIAAGALAAAIAVPVIGTQIGKPDDSHKNDEPDRRPGYEQMDPTYTPDFDPSYDPAIDIEPDEDLDEPDWGIDGDIAEPAKPDNDSTPSQPIPSENPEVEEKHQHVFGKWVDDGNQERRDCINGDHSEYRNHAITLVSEENIINYDGTYTIVKTYKCSSCGKTITEKDVKACDFGEWTYNHETKMDERVCKVTGYKETRTHTHVNGTLTSYDENYEYYECENGCGLEVRQGHNMTERVNSDGSTTHYCTNPGCGYSYTQQPTKPDPGPVDPTLGGETDPDPKPPVHQHSVATRTVYPQSPLEAYCYEEETYCTECHESLSSNKVQHNLDVTYNEDGTETHSCTNPSCTYSYTVQHEHTITTQKKDLENDPEYCYEEVETCSTCGKTIKTTKVKHDTEEKETIYNGEDPDKCYKVETQCKECGEILSTQEFGHSIQDSLNSDTHEVTHKCDKCSYEKITKHNITTRTTTPEDTTDEYCYEEQEYCEDCGTLIGSPRKVEHDYKIEIDPDTFNKTYTCNKCGHVHIEYHYHTLEERKVKATEPTDDFCYTFERYCTECDKPIESAKIGHTFTNGDWGECTECGYTKAEPHRHKEQHKIEMPSRATADYCYIDTVTCSECGEQIRVEYVGHNMNMDDPYDLGDEIEYDCSNPGCMYYELVPKEDTANIQNVPLNDGTNDSQPENNNPVVNESIVPPEVIEPPEGSNGEVIESSDEPKEPSVDEQPGEPEVIPSQPETPPTESDVIPSEPEVTPIEPNEDIPTESSPEQEIIPDNEPNPDNGLGEQIDTVEEQEDLTSTISNEEKPYVLTLHMD